MAEVEYALSLKQPWATLLAHGVKTIEVRRWPTGRLGRILIHAARVPVTDAQVWALVPEALRREAEMVGGIIGVGQLTGCIVYQTPETFAADRDRHLNDPSWFRPPVLYGFTFEQLTPLPFRRYPGWMRFFRVDSEVPPRVSESRPRKNGAAQKGLFE